MKRWLWIPTALGVTLAACAPASSASRTESVAPASTPGAASAPEQENSVPSPLPDGPVAPELTNDTWLNSEPLRFADLRGQVALIDFWTFG